MFTNARRCRISVRPGPQNEHYGLFGDERRKARHTLSMYTEGDNHPR
jgi:hypothetical protein